MKTTADKVRPGTVLLKNGISYIRVEDSIARHLEGVLLRVGDGKLIHWTQVFGVDELVEYV